MADRVSFGEVVARQSNNGMQLTVKSVTPFAKIKSSATRQGWSRRNEVCDDFMKLRLSSSGCETRPIRGEPARIGSEPCDGSGNTPGDA
jgi:hypothetical protein